MDALKKAELAKNQARSGSVDERSEPAGFPSLALEPIEKVAPAGNASDLPKASPPPVTEQFAGADSTSGSAGPNSSRLPELPANLQGLDAQFIAHHAEQTPAPRAIVQDRVAQSDRPTPAVAPAIATPKTRTAAPLQNAPLASDTDRATARNLFETKESSTPAPKRAFAIGVGVVTLLAALGIGGDFWWQLQPKNALVGGAIPSRAAPPVAPITQSPQVAPSAAASAASTPLQGNASVPSAVSPAPTFAAASKVTNDDSEEDAKPARIKRPEANERKPAPDRAAGSLVQTTKKPLQTNPVLASAYELFNRGDFAAARKEYQRALAAEPQNIDALHGLAAIALKERHPETAEHFFQRILVADPRDAVAQSGLLGLRGNTNPGGTESQLRAIAAAQPELAAAQIALGNLYSAQNRWNEAQQAYFNAYASEPENPDLLFNLAISLEHLRKPALALQYYRLAIAAARQRPSGFDPALAEERLRDLQP
jgi:tetratricopeptide (TPR) repeat protein